MARRSSRKKSVSEINVVPLIDVMLVLLIIFMVTAPLLNQGVEVDLPKGVAEALPQQEQEPMVLTVDREGHLYPNRADDPKLALSTEDLLIRARAVLQREPKTVVLVKGDKGVEYGKVVAAMHLLTQAGAAKVGLSMDLPDGA